ncbi:DUF2516 family protein [Aeromicrobium sp. 636]|uniref:DUF2516 family protein n=1 Tax=Aeromicrobium senzhongii TaxID=2663859 RepID=A0A8I0EXK8_9ACTN|nr:MULTISPECIES: DUF2516 family protein [Aeromicrobium]MBC9227232.1 DUF2516 family protein [Aeromicrobium senzhongii]MCQ3999331.1 DUF2516 family protein [Aeromicrobium sp. 636]MTB88357.1 DUF2516 family protein [Aeromicrobium senzhongii]QNL94668.1 DUF2516 family protein [Aeromicrobium senzhongii]
MALVTPLIWWLLLATKVFALVDCVRRKPYDFEMAGTLPKNIWLVILPVSILVDIVFQNPLGILPLLGTVAALVYLAQTRGSGY